MTDLEAAAGSRSPDKASKHHAKPGKVTHIRHRRPPKRLSRRPNDIYVNRASQFRQQLARCHLLLDQSVDDVTVHGLGTAIHRAINLALELQETSSHCLQLTVSTSTVQLVDDLEPVDDDMEYQTQSRPSSAIHIHIAKVPQGSSSALKTTPPSVRATPPSTKT